VPRGGKGRKKGEVAWAELHLTSKPKKNTTTTIRTGQVDIVEGVMAKDGRETFDGK